MIGKYDEYVKFLEKAEYDGFYDWTPDVFSPRERLPFKNNSNLNPFNFNGGYLKNIPEKVPFGYSDIKTCMAFRRKGFSAWYFPSRVHVDSITIDDKKMSYEDMSYKYEWCIGDTSAWHECKKEPE